MLKRLKIQNYALIQDLNVNWQPGFSTITGETGAGKSIMLGALQLLMGQRADLSVLRDSESKCVIEAEFNLSRKQIKELFEQEDLDYEVDTIIRREITPSGKSRSFVNDSPVNLSALKALGSELLDIHSQHQNLLLASADFQLQVLDQFAGLSQALDAYKKLYKDFKKAEKELAQLKDEQAQFQKEADYTQFLFQELNDLKLEDPEELNELEAEFNLLSNAEAIQQHIAEAQQLGTHEIHGIESQLSAFEKAVKEAGLKWEKLESFGSRAESLRIEFQDLLAELERQAEDVEANPLRLEEVTERISAMNALLVKHKAQDIAELIQIRERLSSDLSGAFEAESRIQQLESDLAALKNKLEKEAGTLSNQRQAKTKDLEKQVLELLNQLGMSEAQFKVQMERRDFTETGIDELSYLFTANKGMQPSNLVKVASGGEMARIMLALKWILAQHKNMPTIIFDEIDTGVSGEVAAQMAQLMSEMSRKTQVISITHLANIASRGAIQYKVEKEHGEDRTHTRMRELSADERIVELAEMIGGRNPGEHALASAKALLKS